MKQRIDLPYCNSPNLVDRNGLRLGEMVAKHLPEFLEGKLLPENAESTKVTAIHKPGSKTG